MPENITIHVSPQPVSSVNVAVDNVASYYYDLAKQWAISPDLVEQLDYSSKYYANLSSTSATIAQNAADSILNNAGFIAVSADLTNIDLVAGSITDVNTLADITSDISATALIATDISTLADTDNLTAITTCSTNMSDINTCADNIAVITNKANISLDNLNATGKARIAIKEYLNDETYVENDIVVGFVDDRVVLYKSLSDNNTGNPLSDTDYWEQINLGGSSLILGQSIESPIPLTDACLHLQDGALINGDGIYADFVEAMIDLYTNNPTANYFCSEADWQTANTTYGECGKSVVDTVNNTVRLPKRTSYIQPTTDENQLGNLTQAGLPNITAGVIFNGCGGTTTTTNGAWNYTASPITSQGGTGMAYGGVDFDASRCSSVYGNSTTVQTQSTKVFYYIVVATTQKQPAEVVIDNVVTDLNGKADTDLTNTTAVGKALMAKMSLPSNNTYTDFVIGASGSQYVAPAEGYIFFGTRGGTSDSWIILTTDHYRTGANCYSGIMAECYLPVQKGETITIYYGGLVVIGGQDEYLRFMYAQGEV